MATRGLMRLRIPVISGVLLLGSGSGCSSDHDEPMRASERPVEGAERANLTGTPSPVEVAKPVLGQVGHTASDTARCLAPMLAADLVLVSQRCLQSFTGGTPDLVGLKFVYREPEQTQIIDVSKITAVTPQLSVLQLKKKLRFVAAPSLASVLPSDQLCAGIASSGDLSKTSAYLARDRHSDLPGVPCRGPDEATAWSLPSAHGQDAAMLYAYGNDPRLNRSSDIVFADPAKAGGQPSVLALVDDPAAGTLINICAAREALRGFVATYVPTRSLAPKKPANACTKSTVWLRNEEPRKNHDGTVTPDFKLIADGTQLYVKSMLWNRDEEPVQDYGSDCRGKTLKASKPKSCGHSSTINFCGTSKMRFAVVFAQKNSLGLSVRKTQTAEYPDCGAAKLELFEHQWHQGHMYVRPGGPSAVTLDLTNTGTAEAKAIQFVPSSRATPGNIWVKGNACQPTLKPGKSCRLELWVAWESQFTEDQLQFNVNYTDNNAQPLSVALPMTIHYLHPVTGVSLDVTTQDFAVPALSALEQTYRITNTGDYPMDPRPVTVEAAYGGVVTPLTLISNDCGLLPFYGACYVKVKVDWPGSGQSVPVTIKVGDTTRTDSYLGLPATDTVNFTAPTSTVSVPFMGSKLVPVRISKATSSGIVEVTSIRIAQSSMPVSIDAQRCIKRLTTSTCTVYVTLPFNGLLQPNGTVSVVADYRVEGGRVTEMASKQVTFAYTQAGATESLKWSPLPMGFVVAPSLVPTMPISLSVQNKSAAAVNLANFTIDQDATITDNQCATTLSPGASCILAVSFVWSPGDDPRAVTISADVSRPDGVVSRVAKVYQVDMPAATGALVATIEASMPLVFATLPISYSIRLSNLGNVALAAHPSLAEAVTLNGTGRASIALDGGCQHLAPNSSCVATLAFSDRGFWEQMPYQSQAMQYSFNFIDFNGQNVQANGSLNAVYAPAPAHLNLSAPENLYSCGYGNQIDLKHRLEVYNSGAAPAANVRYYLALASNLDQRYELDVVEGCGRAIGSGERCTPLLQIQDAYAYNTLAQRDSLFVVDYEAAQTRKTITIPTTKSIFPVRVVADAHYTWEHGIESRSRGAVLINDTSCPLQLDHVVVRRALTIQNQDLELTRIVSDAPLLPAGPGASVHVWFPDIAHISPDYLAVAYAVSGRINGSVAYSLPGNLSYGMRRPAGQLDVETASWMVNAVEGATVRLTLRHAGSHDSGYIHVPRLIWTDADQPGPTYFGITNNFCEGRVLAPAARASYERPNSCTMDLLFHAQDPQLEGQTRRVALEFRFQDDAYAWHSPHFILGLRFPQPLQVQQLWTANEVTNFVVGQPKQLSYFVSNNTGTNVYLGSHHLEGVSGWETASTCPRPLGPGGVCYVHLVANFPFAHFESGPATAVYELSYGFDPGNTFAKVMRLPFRYLSHPAVHETGINNTWQFCATMESDFARSYGGVYAFGADGKLRQTFRYYNDSQCLVPLTAEQEGQIVGDMTDFTDANQAAFGKVEEYIADYSLSNAGSYGDGQLFELNINLVPVPGASLRAYREWAWVRADGSLHLSRGFCRGITEDCPLNGMVQGSNRPGVHVLNQAIDPYVAHSGHIRLYRRDARVTLP